MPEARRLGPCRIIRIVIDLCTPKTEDLLECVKARNGRRGSGLMAARIKQKKGIVHTCEDRQDPLSAAIGLTMNSCKSFLIPGTLCESRGNGNNQNRLFALFAGK
jgi:hypothetical protein